MADQKPNDRQIELTGQDNFRDLGGYETSDGRRVKWRHLYRSGELTELSDDDVEKLAERIVRFVADNHLGRLARFLRLLGLDTLYERGWNDPEIVRISTAQQRIVLTRDAGLLKRGSVTHGYYVRAVDAREQVTEVVRRFHLARRLAPFTRCMVCNGALVPVAKKQIAHRLPPETRRHVDDYRECSSCGKVYWEGAHHPELDRIVAAALQAHQVSE